MKRKENSSAENMHNSTSLNAESGGEGRGKRARRAERATAIDSLFVAIAVIIAFLFTRRLKE